MFIPVLSCTTFKALNDQLRAWLRVEAHNLDPEFGKIVDSEVNWFAQAISTHLPACTECAAKGLPARCVWVSEHPFGLARHPWQADEFIAGTDLEPGRPHLTNGASTDRKFDRLIPAPSAGQQVQCGLS